jgi:hypothetical protein
MVTGSGRCDLQTICSSVSGRPVVCGALFTAICILADGDTSWSNPCQWIASQSASRICNSIGAQMDRMASDLESVDQANEPSNPGYLPCVGADVCVGAGNRASSTFCHNGDCHSTTLCCHTGYFTSVIQLNENTAGTCSVAQSCPAPPPAPSSSSSSSPSNAPCTYEEDAPAQTSSCPRGSCSNGGCCLSGGCPSTCTGRNSILSRRRRSGPDEVSCACFGCDHRPSSSSRRRSSSRESHTTISSSSYSSTTTTTSSPAPDSDHSGAYNGLSQWDIVRCVSAAVVHILTLWT